MFNGLTPCEEKESGKRLELFSLIINLLSITTSGLEYYCVGRIGEKTIDELSSEVAVAAQMS